ncbi:polyketide cyclase [Spirosoma endbachense]|uniref:Polyketide cyclase n=2 Tax=Spirosoma endbachense TaxID=2666025 RepID=A0A6P1W6S1_9BACT|nr:polyketide cyclase [Spirosoma endbachense]
MLEKSAPGINAYHFITHWHVAALSEEVYRTLEDIDALARWWPAVYLDVKVLEKGQPGGVDKVVELYTKGWLPYTLRWKFRVTKTSVPTGFALEAFGDFVGRGIWTFTGEGSGTHITYDWLIEAEKPLLKKLSFLLKPIFSMNHEWAMRKGLESLQLELRRRKGEKNVPPPPQPTFPHNLLKRSSANLNL